MTGFQTGLEDCATNANGAVAAAFAQASTNRGVYAGIVCAMRRTAKFALLSAKSAVSEPFAELFSNLSNRAILADWVEGDVFRLLDVDFALLVCRHGERDNSHCKTNSQPTIAA